MWAWPALAGAGDGPVLRFGLASCLGGLIGSGWLAAGWARQLGGPWVATSEGGPLRRVAWAMARVAGIACAGLVALAAGWGLVCLARVAAISA